MRHTRFARLAALAAMTAGGAATGTRLFAQAPVVTPVQGAQAQPAVQLAFGYECDDRFLVRNDGTEPVDLEYAVAGGSEHWKLHLKEKESVELSSAANKALELWVNGKLVASATKAKRACAANQAVPGVVVRPLGSGDYVSAAAAPAYGYGYAYGPRVVYYDPWPYYYPASYFSIGFPIYGGFGGFGGFGRVVFRGRGRH
jgi:hypothetical protein